MKGKATYHGKCRNSRGTKTQSDSRDSHSMNQCCTRNSKNDHLFWLQTAVCTATAHISNIIKMFNFFDGCFPCVVASKCVVVNGDAVWMMGFVGVIPVGGKLSQQCRLVQVVVAN